MRHRLTALLGFALLCAALVGCGGSATPATATATTASPTRAATNAPATSAAATVAPTTPAATTASATVAPPTTAAATVAPTSAPAAPASAGGGNAVAVELKNFAIALSTSSVTAGMVTFTIMNSGPSPHNFNVMVNGEEKGVPTLDPGKMATLTLDLKPGSYDFRCNIPGHNLLGMKGTIIAK